MNILQQHLVDNYNRHLHVIFKKCADKTVARRAISNAYIKFNNSKIEAIDIEKLIYVTLVRCAVEEKLQSRSKIEAKFEYFETEEDLIHGIGYTDSTLIEDITTKELTPKMMHLMETKLTDKMKKIVKLHLFEGMTLIEVAKKIKKNYNSTKHMYLYAIRKLRAEMRKDL